MAVGATTTPALAGPAADAAYGSTRTAATAAERAAAAAAAGAAAAGETAGGTKVYVGGLSAGLGKGEVEAIFTPFGKLDGVHLLLDPLTGLHKGFAFVHFRRRADADRCINAMDSTVLDGRVI